MSLIGDALRKARQEASERESDRKGILFSAKIADSPGRSNLGLGLALGALIAVFATVAGGAAVWWVLGGADTDGPPTIEATQSSLIDQVIDDPDPVPDPASDQASSPKPQAPNLKPQASSLRPQASKTAAEAVPDAISSSDGESTDGGVQPPEPEMPESGFLGKEDGEEIYILEADLGNGVNLSLDFLIFREDDPFAEINGIELHLGGTIEGFRVKDIERDRVKLSNGRRTIVLRAP